MPDPFGPKFANVDRFQDFINAKMAGCVMPVYLDVWDLHMEGGEVHCGSNVKRKRLTAGSPATLVEWWTAWQKEENTE